MIPGVKSVIFVFSGKGGVGKSTISTKLAISLRNKGFKVGLLDIDLCGPSIPYLLNLEKAAVHHCPEGWVPVYTDDTKTLAVMSIGFILNDKNECVVWRGPKKTAMIKQFLTDVYWQDIDFLIVDTPPGTSDEHITIVENTRDMKNGAIIVTAPQAVSIEDVRKEVTFCKKTGVPILGIVENLSGYVCPNCSDCSNVFSKGGGELLAKHTGVPFLGMVPIDSQIRNLEGLPEGSPLEATFNNIINAITGL